MILVFIIWFSGTSYRQEALYISHCRQNTHTGEGGLSFSSWGWAFSPDHMDKGRNAHFQFFLSAFFYNGSCFLNFY